MHSSLADSMASLALRPKRLAGLSRGFAERRTRALAVTAALTTFAVLAAEIAHVWRRGDAPMPAETDDVVHAAEIAIGQTVQVARAGYQSGSRRENALLNLLLAFTATFVFARASTAVIHERGHFGPLRDLIAGEDHIHHFIPGIALAFVAGAVSIVSRDERLDPLLALPFGAGVALTLDESALLLKLDDVYWTEEGILSVQITFATMAMLSALTLVLRTLHRGENEVLTPPR
jgi:hypothetical protein